MKGERRSGGTMEQQHPKEEEPDPVCAACSGDEDVVPVDESGDTFFCAECRAMMLTYDPNDPYVDIGPSD